MTTLSFYRRVIDETGHADRGQISPGEAGDVCAQLPRDLMEVWEDA